MTTHPIDRLLPYLRGELAAAERAAMDTHLAACVECRDTVRDFATLAERLARAPEPAPPLHWGAFRAQLRDKLERRQHPAAAGRRWSLWPVPATLAAGLAAADVAGAASSSGATPRTRRTRAISSSASRRRRTIPASGWTRTSR